MVYFFDGTKPGFLTAFVRAFTDDNALLTSKQIQLPLGEASLFVHANESLSKTAEARLLTFDQDCMRDLEMLLRCGELDNEQVAFRYLRLLAQTKRPIHRRFANPDVFHAVEYIKKVSHEIHKFHGFIRFMETQSGALYAPFSPDHDICDLLAPHFKARLPQFPFVLHDVKRKKATVYDGQNLFTAPLHSAAVLLAADENAWQSLWKGYYAAVNIPSRERIKQMRAYMPTRYWQFLTEKQDFQP